ncbi:hypothetical protein [Pyxidicoccus caerfyrddinensis]|uniref:hypothetical protein n=1 Tax=Pyxidicoccus caerfyrddinensis TaxID=2709663 RepID=UPI0013D92E14|nr:hypothetical protein [Pyxidicoccus caerfyrddinensis]
MTCSRITFEVPVVTKNPTNQREHPMARHRRAQGQRDTTGLLWPGWMGPALLVVRLTRVAPRRLDRDDNLPSALKSVRDEVARQLRVDDASPLVRWVYAQLQGEPRVLVELAWGDDELAVAVRAQDALAPPPPPAPLEPRAARPTRPRAAKKAPQTGGLPRSLADLVKPAFRKGGVP